MSSKYFLIALAASFLLAGCGTKRIEAIRFVPYDCGVVQDPDPVLAQPPTIHGLAVSPEGWVALLENLLDWEKSTQQMADRLQYYKDCIDRSKQ